MLHLASRKDQIVVDILVYVVVDETDDVGESDDHDDDEEEEDKNGDKVAYISLGR